METDILLVVGLFLTFFGGFLLGVVVVLDTLFKKSDHRKTFPPDNVVTFRKRKKGLHHGNQFQRKYPGISD